MRQQETPDSGRLPDELLAAKPDPRATLRIGTSAFKFLAFSTVAQGTNLILGIVRSKLLAHFIGANGVGIAAEVNQLVTLLTVLGAMAYGPGLTRGLAEAGEASDPVRFRRITANAVVVALALNGVGAAICVAVAPFVFSRTTGVEESWVILAAASAIATAVGSVVLQSHVVIANVRAVAISSIVGAIGGTAATAVLVARWGVSGQFVAIAVSAALSLIVTIAIRHPVGLPSRRDFVPDRAFLKDTVTLGGAVTITSFAWQFCFTSVRAWLQSTGGEANGTRFNGLYQAAFALSYIYMGVAGSTCTGYFYPRFAAAPDATALRAEAENAARFTLRLLFPLVLVGASVRAFVIRITYSAEFHDASDLLGYEMAGDILKGIAWVPTGLLIMRGRARGALMNDLVGVGICMGFMLPLISVVGPVGAGLGHLAGFVVFAPTAFLVAGALLGHTILPWRVLAFGFGASGIVAALVWASGRYPWLGVLGVLGAGVYVVRSGLWRDFLDKVRRRSSEVERGAT